MARLGISIAKQSVGGRVKRDIDCEAIGGWEGENARRGGWVEIVENRWI
jgi:hypothetical protein